MGIFDGIFNNKPAERAAAAQRAGLEAGYGMAQPLLQQGADALKTNFAAGLDPFLKNFATANQGQQTYADAVGANGQEGFDRATTNFRADPGFKFALDTGNENVLRNAARTGNLASGGTDVDLMKFGQGLADQQYGNYVQRLQPFIGASGAAAGGIGGLYAGLGTQLNGNYGTQANLAYGTQTGIGNANASAELNQGNVNKNILGAGQQGMELAAKFLPFLFSDERVKEDIEPIGELYDGQPIYRYKYIGDDPTTHIGLLAQEVEELEPDAVAEFGGIKAVDYKRATNFAAGLAEFV
jgi:hypothetical protein